MKVYILWKLGEDDYDCFGANEIIGAYELEFMAVDVMKTLARVVYDKELNKVNYLNRRAIEKNTKKRHSIADFGTWWLERSHINDEDMIEFGDLFIEEITVTMAP